MTARDYGARAFLSPAAYDELFWLLRREGDRVGGQVCAAIGDWVECSGASAEDLAGDDESAALDVEVACEHAAEYLRDCPSHGEFIGCTLAAWPLWRGARGAADLLAALERAIAHASRHGVDH